jgi:hypothetical protein
LISNEFVSPTALKTERVTHFGGIPAFSKDCPQFRNRRFPISRTPFADLVLNSQVASHMSGLGDTLELGGHQVG